MRTFTISEAATDFRKILPFVQNGERVRISNGRSRKPIAILVPFRDSKSTGRKIGILEGKVSFSEVGNGKITEEEFLGL